MNDLKFSIIIPVYKTEKFLQRSLSSAMNQTEKNIEIIVVNDGSPGDECDSIISRTKDMRIKYIKKEHNEGLFLARKTGILEASGDFVIHLDADDELKLNACEILHAKINETLAFSEADYITYRYELKDNDSVYQRSLDAIGDTLEEIVTYQKYHMVWAKAYSTKFIRRIYQAMPDFYLVYFEDYYQESIIQYWAQKRCKVDAVLYTHYDDIGVSRKALYDNMEMVKKIDLSAQNILLYLCNFFADKETKYCAAVQNFIMNFYIHMLPYTSSLEVITLIFQRIGAERFIPNLYTEMKKQIDLINTDVETLNYLRPVAKLIKPIIILLRKIKHNIK